MAVVIHLALVFVCFLVLMILAVWGIRALWRMIRGTKFR
jgi:uncharacterized membrane protein YdbT with pleckstrin-like domain